MKIDARSIDRYLANPGETRAALLYGEDEGLVRLRAEALTKAVIGSKDDPFRVSWLARDEHDRLLEEASAISMIPGRRVIRVRDATDGLAASLKRAVETPGDSLIILEAGTLTHKGKLRLLCESCPAIAVVACYADNAAALQQMIALAFKGAGLVLDEDAKTWLRDHLGSDRATTLGELEKLVVYAGGSSHLTLEEVQSCMGEQGGVSLDDAVDAIMIGDVRQADRSIGLALEGGAAPVAVCRTLLAHMVRLQGAAFAVSMGTASGDAIKQVRPPVFFARASAFGQGLRCWPFPRIRHALDAIRRVEFACKQSQAPDHLLVHRLVAALARQAAQKS